MSKNIYKITNEGALVKILDEKKHLVVSALIGISTDDKTKKFKPTYIKYAKNFPRILFLCIMLDNYEDGDYDFKHNIKGFPTIMFFYRSQEITRILGGHEKQQIVSTLEYLDLLHEKANEIDLQLQKYQQMILYKAYADETIRLRQQAYIRQFYEQQQKQFMALANTDINAPKTNVEKKESVKEESDQDETEKNEKEDHEENDEEETSEKKLVSLVPTNVTKTAINEKETSNQKNPTPVQGNYQTQLWSMFPNTNIHT